MSYYPTERRGGCMESISRCCRQAYVYPVDSRKLLYAAGAVGGVILVAVIWSGLSSGDNTPQPEPFKGSSVLQQEPLIIGCNYFPSNLRDQVHNNVSKVQFDQNLKDDSIFGSTNCKSCETDLSRLQSGLVASQIWSINVSCDAMYKDAVAVTLEQVDAVTRLINKYPNNLAFVESSSEITMNFQKKKIGSILAITSGHSIDGRLPVLRTLQKLGVRVMAITSSCNPSWATSYNSTSTDGLSPFGKALVKEMNRLGIVIDLSEASHQTQLDVLNITKAPVIFSHAAAYSLVKDERNIKDDVLDLLKTNQGMVMVTFVQKYLSTNATNASVSSVIEHINYIKNRTGIAGVGIGAEFDAAEQTYPTKLNDVSTFPSLFDELGNTWTDHEDLKKLAGGNFLRVLEAVEKYAKDSESMPVDETYALQFNSPCYSDYKSRETLAIEANGTTPAASTPTALPSPTPSVTPTTLPPTVNTTVVSPTTTNATETTKNVTASTPGS